MTFIQQWASGGGGGPAQYLDTTYSPVALYLLNESLSDSSASGFADLTVTGNELYADVGLGLRGFYYDGSSSLALTSVESAVQIIGDLTLEMIVSISSIPTSNLYLIRCNGDTDLEQYNFTYQIGVQAGTSNIYYFAEYGAGVNISYYPNVGVNLGEAVHIAMVRSSNEVTFYFNGLQIGATSSGLNAPTGGTSSTVRFGDGNLAGGWVLSSVKIIASALTPTQVKGEYNSSLGPVLGLLP